MTLKEIKDWIESLPHEFLSFTVVSAEEGQIVGTENTYRLDKPIVSLDADVSNEEILFFIRKRLTESN